MRFSRREVIKGMGAAGLTPLLVSCGSDGGGEPALPPLPDGLPEYEFDGTPGPATTFEHGVASGDPLADGVILWTRLSPGGGSTEPIEVWWETSLDPDFTQRTAQGTTTTSAAADYTAKVDVSGLIWGRNYYYRFFALGRQSPIGRTRLAPSGGVDRLRFAVCSCSNYGFGFFHAYKHMAERADLDAVIHLGDYFYEYGDGTFPEPPSQLRMLDPPTETITLDDYRRRFAQYRRDPDLQELHRQVPFIVVWDDHETANNSWMGGAENHNEDNAVDEGSWEGRLGAARQAFFEWVPIRETPGQRLFRKLEYGALADVIMLDTRIEGREQQSEGILCDTIADAATLPNQMLGPEQEQWLFEELSNSTGRWKIVGNQVVMSLWSLGGEGAFLNPDQWNCYPAARDRLVAFLRDEGIGNVVVVTGDVHSSWAMDVTLPDGSYTPETRDAAVAVEFVAPGITSPPSIPSGVVEGLVATPHIRAAEVGSIGYFVLDLRSDKAQADWYFVAGLDAGEDAQRLWQSWAVLDSTRSLVEMDGPEIDDPSAPPLAPV